MGVRIRGRRRSFDVRWDQLERIEIARLPNPPLVGMSKVDRFIFYGFRTREGTLAGMVAPKAELGPERGATLESAVSRLASLHRIGLVQVSSQEFRTWRRQIRPAAR
jgi:aminoglycoside phosphotransferase (APT) family kinase protein